MTPYQRGEASFQRGEGGPPIRKGDATWAERLFNRGWCDARDRLALQSPPAKVEGRREALARMVAIDEDLGLYDE